MMFLGANINRKRRKRKYLEVVPDTGGGEDQEETFLTEADYYVSADASGTDNGLSPITPWSLAQLNAASLSPGDVVALKASDEFDGAITVPSSGTNVSRIKISAYGTGFKPKIYSSVPVTGWTLHSGNIYKATITSDVKQLFIDGVRMRLARYPNTGYFNITTVNSTTQFTSTSLDSGINYTGATWVGRTSAYTIFHKQVTTSSSQTITLESAPTYSLGVGEGFFLTNKLVFLTEAGEWFYDSSTDLLYVWTPNGDHPDNYTVRASILDYGVYINSKSYVDIENLEILHSGNTGVYVNLGTSIKVDNTKIMSPDLYGIYVSNGSSGGTFTNNYIYQTGGGIRCLGGSSVTIEDNTIERIGQLEDINKTVYAGDNYGTGIYLRNNNPTVRYNTILDVGYAGINWRGLGMIKYNFIDGACQVVDDGGAIYTYNAGVPTASSGSEVMYNIVLNVHGNPNGFTATYDQAYGIYMDNETTGVTIQYNIIAHVVCGLYIHFGDSVTCQYNKLFDFVVGARSSGENGNSYYYDNVFFAEDGLYDYVWWTDKPQHMAVNDSATPIYDRNEYYHSYATLVFRQGSSMNFASWKTTTGQDANSVFDGTAMDSGETADVFYNNTKASKMFYLHGATAKDPDGTPISSDFVLQPFTGRIIRGQNINLISDVA